jgi:hypothetical protein
VHLREDLLRQRLRDPSSQKSATAARPARNTHWKIVTVPPAVSIPALTDSATRKRVSDKKE